MKRLSDVSQFLHSEVLERLLEIDGFNYEYTDEFITLVNKGRRS
ncbi:hypothetical protein ACUXCC_002293 [Cytobacillus horneckiae]